VKVVSTFEPASPVTLADPAVIVKSGAAGITVTVAQAVLFVLTVSTVTAATLDPQTL
jgi:hypothetical protein